jgi:hypothetical protein
VASTQRQRLACSAETHEDLFIHVKIVATHRQVEARLARLHSEVFCQRSLARSGRPVPANYGTRSSKCGLLAGPRSGHLCSQSKQQHRTACASIEFMLSLHTDAGTPSNPCSFWAAEPICMSNLIDHMRNLVSPNRSACATPRSVRRGRAPPANA